MGRMTSHGDMKKMTRRPVKIGCCGYMVLVFIAEKGLIKFRFIRKFHLHLWRHPGFGILAYCTILLATCVLVGCIFAVRLSPLVSRFVSYPISLLSTTILP